MQPSSLARKRKQAVEVTQRRGVVVRTEGASVWVDDGDGVFEAKRAVSCLLEPVKGDLVLAAVGEDGISHVLSVLEREEGAPAHVAFDRDVVIKVVKSVLRGRAGWH